MAATAGVSPADVLARAAGEVRRAGRQCLDVATATLGVRIVLPLGLVFLPAFVLTTVVPIVLALAHQMLVTQMTQPSNPTLNKGDSPSHINWGSVAG